MAKDPLAKTFRRLDDILERLHTSWKRRTHDPLLDPLPPAYPSCEYPFEGLEPDGECPECGEAYTEEQVEKSREKRLWRRRNEGYRKLGLLIPVDIAASFVWLLVYADGNNAEKFARAILLAPFKVVILDVLIVMGALLFMMGVSYKKQPLRGVYIGRGAWYGGLTASLALIVIALLQLGWDHLWYGLIPLGIIIGGSIGRIAHAARPIVHSPYTSSK